MRRWPCNALADTLLPIHHGCLMARPKSTKRPPVGRSSTRSGGQAQNVAAVQRPAIKAAPPDRHQQQSLGDAALAALGDGRARRAALAVIEAAVKADEEERRRFAAAVSRTTGTGGGDPLAVAAKAYLGDLWALAALGDDMAVRRKALAILGDVAATMAGTEPTGTPRGGVGRTPATTRHRAPGKKA
jgi:hypothetical protein